MDELSKQILGGAIQEGKVIIDMNDGALTFTSEIGSESTLEKINP